MTTDMERELRELFREKAGEAPTATFDTSGAAPQEVLRRGRRRQVGTVLGSAAIVLVLIVGSVAGLNAMLRGEEDPFRTGDYDIFERTATIEAFTVTSPSDWYLVNEWPLSMQMAATSGSASEECTAAAPGAGQPSPVCTSSEPSIQVEALPHGLPMFQLSNVDMGLTAVSCGQDLPTDAAVLYVGLDYERAIFGAKDPSIGPWPVELREPEAADGPCGAGRYATFSVNGQPFFAWVGFGTDVTDAGRSTVLAAYESMVVDDGWEPIPPNAVTPAYVIAGGEHGPGDDWRLELRPDGDALELSLQDGPAPTASLTDGSVEPLTWTGTDPIFGAITRAATGVEFRPGAGNVDYDLGQSPVTGSIMPVPPTLGSFGFDLFFIDPPAGYGELGGHVIALGLESASPAPPEIARPRARTVELSGSFEGRDWSARFTGAFTGPGSPCVEVTIEGRPPGHFCPDPVHSTLAGPTPYLNGIPSSELYLLVGSVPPEIVQIRFDGDDDAIVPQEFRCEMGPLGWTDPDRKVCTIALPSSGSGTLRYLDATGDVVYEEGIGWGAAEPELCCPVDPALGRTFWAVYAWIGSGDEEAEIEMAQRYLDNRGVHGLRGSLFCDEGAAEALGTSAEHKVAVYFETKEEANTFALEAGLLGHEAGPVVAKVTIACLE